MIKEAEKPNGLVRSLMAPSPSLEFSLVRKRADGSEEEYPFRCRLLRQAQTEDALAAAQKAAEKREAKGYTDIYKENQAVEILQRAIVRVEREVRGDGTEFDLPMFTSAQQLKESLDTEELAQMLSAYELVRAHFRFNQLATNGGVEGLIDALAGELSGPFFLSRVDSEEWPHLIYALARLALTWRPESPPTPSDSDSFSESDPASLPSGITGSSELPELRSAILPKPVKGNRKTMTREEAKAKVKAAQLLTPPGSDSPTVPLTDLGASTKVPG